QAFFNFSKNWLSLRIHGDKLTVNFVQVVASDDLGGGTVRSLMLARDGQPIRYTDRVQVATPTWHQARDYRHPSAFSINADLGGVALSVEARNGRYGEEIDPLRSLSNIERSVVRALVTKPALYRMVMDTTVKVVDNGVTYEEKLPAAAGMLYFEQ
ncbi:MAG: hypothetical protein ACTSXZ_03415, partial [Alphaproteobacteria bacterium]